MRTMALRDERTAMHVVLETSTDHHHSKCACQHAVDFARNLVPFDKHGMVPGQKLYKCLLESGVHKAIQSNKERTRPNDGSSEDDYMSFQKECQGYAHNDATDDEDNTACTVGNYTGAGPREHKDCQIKACYSTNRCESKAPEVYEETATDETDCARDTNVHPFRVSSVAFGRLKVTENDPCKSGCR